MMTRPALLVSAADFVCAHARAADVAFRSHDLEEPWAVGINAAADLDGDKDIDLAASTDESFQWVENTDGAGRFAHHEIESTQSAPNVVLPRDLDGDGDMDLVAHARASGGAIAWYANDGRARQWTKQLILAGEMGRPMRRIAVADADGDKDLDLVMAGPGLVVAARDPAVSTGWGPPTPFGTTAATHVAVAAADFDADGDLDLVTGSDERNEIAYLDSEGQSWKDRRVLQTVSHAAYLPASSEPVDFDGDGDTDLFVVTESNQAMLFENQDGKGDLVPKELATVQNLVLATPADVDGDGDVDIVAARRNPGEGLLWIENDGGNFSKQHPITADWETPTFLTAADIDGDGDQDVVSVSGSIDGPKAAWWENGSK